MSNTRLTRFIAAALSFAVLTGPLVLTSCKKGEKTSTKAADYGSYGADIAREIASKFPDRKPYSEGESAVGDYIAGKIKEIGYTPEVQTFSKEVGEGEDAVTKSSANYIIKIPGTGFYCRQDDGTYQIEHRVAVIGAHYDAAILPEFAPKEDEKKKDDKKKSDKKEDGEAEPTERPKYVFDGISDNASGTACVLTAMMAFKEYTNIAYDVWFVFFGAGTDNFAGAEKFVTSLPGEELLSIDVMYDIDSLYAGDKVYASSGYKSLLSTQKYEMRRKLYQAYDVCFANPLYTYYRFDLYYNESGLKFDINEDGYKDIYNEVSGTMSDYKLFDERGIPVVYFESFDYNYTALEKMKETKNLNIQDFGGKVRGTPSDCTYFLDELLITEDVDRNNDGEIDCSGDRLQIRVNCVAFIVIESLLKGSDKGMTPAQYEEFKKEATRQTYFTESSATSETSESST